MRQYYLIGERLGHSFSAEIHRAFGRYPYALRELAPAELAPFLARRDFAGLNVTIPYKEAVIPYLDHLDPAAAAVGAVNTVVNRDGALWGYNTDFGGLRDALCALFGLPDAARPLAGRRVLILGTGGSSKTAAAVCEALGAAALRRVSRTGREGALRYEALADLPSPDYLVNCTPVGMWPEPDGAPLQLLPAGIGALPFSRLAGVFDCVYNPLRTRLVLDAQARGLPAGGGLAMLVRQAALSCGRFTGEAPDEAELARVYAGLRRTRENLVLIGMPGAGKTTVGRILAQKTGKEFVDLDEEIERRAGKTIAAIFAEAGEARFRALEAELIRTLAGTGGRVIATGGGSILRAENVLRLKQNGRLILLERPLAALRPAAERPLGDTAEKLARLWDERRPLYEAAAELRIREPADPARAAAAIVEAVEARTDNKGGVL